MQKVTLEDFKIPNTCGECNFIGHYEIGVYRRNPHCCCGLIWYLKHEDYRVDKNSLDENCPLKVINTLKI
jgi:hypothetical protein